MLSRRKAEKESVLPDSGINDEFWNRYLEICSKINGRKISSSLPYIMTMHKYFDHLNLPRPSSLQIHALMTSPFTRGDPTKTFHLIRYFQLSQKGDFITNENIDKAGSIIKYVGAENWESVMCYMDALLFAMYTNLDSFEPTLFLSNQNKNVLVNRLSNLLRVYVNLLRSGNLIKTDLTIQICETLDQLGFKEAMSHKQQDAATLFEFLTETLRMPLLTFKIDIQHGGKFNEQDDRKYSKERMLFVSLPELDEDESDNEILLEECLEDYFNNSINVKRELERRATLESFKGLKPTVELIENADDPTRLTSDTKNNTQVQVRTRSSTLSIWTVNEDDRKTKPREVSLPAWMFLRILPFYTDDNEVSVEDDGNVKTTAKDSKEFARRRPVLPICLKRYSFENQQANRLHTKVIIPPIINLPTFVADEVDDEKTSQNYKLILESAICHRGTSISSGHFVAAVRRNYHKINETDDEAYNSCWYLYDDLHKPRVVEKTFKEIFNTEWPYILFYRLVTHEESASAANSMHSFPSSVTNSPKVFAPQGSKDKYWNEEPLSPIISASNSPSLKADSSSSILKESLKHSLSTLSMASDPLPDISPLDSKFTDIKDKYYWYIPDSNMDYYKEDSASKISTRRASLTTAFRRNSQWSDHSDNKLAPQKPETKLEKATSSPSLWSFKRRTKSKSPPPDLHEVESTISHMSLGSVTDADEKDKVEVKSDTIKDAEPSDTQAKRHHHGLHLHNHDEVQKSYKRSRKKREAYKKEKCIIC